MIPVRGRDLRILDFDVEVRPLAWYGGDFVTKQPTAIAWKFLDWRRAPQVAYIGKSDRSSLVLEEEAEMMEAFRAAYDKADVVTGHFIRGFDLTVLTGACIRLGLPLLGDKLAHDTKLDFVKAQGMSKSMENLGAMFELEHPKVPMDTAKWAAANMLLPHGIELTKKRVVGDVAEHIELRDTMLERRLLKPASVWTATSKSSPGYAP